MPRPVRRSARACGPRRRPGRGCRRPDNLVITLARCATRRARARVEAKIEKITWNTWLRHVINWQLTGDTPERSRADLTGGALAHASRPTALSTGPSTALICESGIRAPYRAVGPPCRGIPGDLRQGAQLAAPLWADTRAARTPGPGSRPAGGPSRSRVRPAAGHRWRAPGTTAAHERADCRDGGNPPHPRHNLRSAVILCGSAWLRGVSSCAAARCLGLTRSRRMPGPTDCSRAHGHGRAPDRPGRASVDGERWQRVDIPPEANPTCCSGSWRGSSSRSLSQHIQRDGVAGSDGRYVMAFILPGQPRSGGRCCHLADTPRLTPPTGELPQEVPLSHQRDSGSVRRSRWTSKRPTSW